MHHNVDAKWEMEIHRMHTMGFKMWITRKVHSMHMRQISFENRVRAFLVWIPICICTYVRICVLCVSNKSYFFSKLAKICIKKCVISIMKAYEIQFEYSVCRWIPREIVQHVWISFAYSVTYIRPTNSNLCFESAFCSWSTTKRQFFRA